jgi:hypothetical protein
LNLTVSTALTFTPICVVGRFDCNSQQTGDIDSEKNLMMTKAAELPPHSLRDSTISAMRRKVVDLWRQIQLQFEADPLRADMRAIRTARISGHWSAFYKVRRIRRASTGSSPSCRISRRLTTSPDSVRRRFPRWFNE